MAVISDLGLERYSRQILVSGLDIEAQERLAAASICLIGCGGLGGPLATYLACAGVGHLRLVDADRVELSNLPRQTAFSDQDIGQPKAEALRRFLVPRAPDTALECHPVYFDAASASTLLDGIDLVLDASDTRATRLCIDRETAVRKLPWVMGAAIQFSGQNIIFDAEREFGCYHCLNPVAAEDGGDCAALGVLGPVVGAIALQQAIDALRWITGAGKLPYGQVRLKDFKVDDSQTLSFTPRADCTVCQPVSPDIRADS